MEIDHWHKFPIFKTQKVQCTEGLHQKSRTNYCLFLKTNAFSCFFRCQAPRCLVCETRESWAPGYDNSQPTLCQILIRSAAIAWTTDNLARFCTFFFQVNEFGSDAVLKCRFRQISKSGKWRKSIFRDNFFKIDLVKSIYWEIIYIYNCCFLYVL